ncbi:hypothetical protein B0T16DRAFT_151087 [Cercophora newfieldiana]|uniref:Uncharacterized protein n=1 Tax=Cercophora newfieldiana TaxID=92897 RepID=A0AA40CPL7_9PEZI|nr:hypothetical protein B0T16DRAFT_151087 [Cercophora newfieldiana]
MSLLFATFSFFFPRPITRFLTGQLNDELGCLIASPAVWLEVPCPSRSLNPGFQLQLGVVGRPPSKHPPCSPRTSSPTMSSLQPTAAKLTDEDRSTLEAVYATLRTANEQLKQARVQAYLLDRARVLVFMLDSANSKEYPRYPELYLTREWWSQTRAAGLFDSKELLDRELNEARDTESTLKAAQEALRARQTGRRALICERCPSWTSPTSFSTIFLSL